MTTFIPTPAAAVPSAPGAPAVDRPGEGRGAVVERGPAAAAVPVSRSDDRASPAEPAAPKRLVHIPALDGLRGVAILLVLFFHFAIHDKDAGGLQKWAQKVTGAGWVGVDLFFVLSGFLITSILYEAKRSDGYFKNFYMRRVLRIFPLYYGVLVVAFLVVPLVDPYESTKWQNIERHQGYLWAYLQNFVAIDWKVYSHFWSLAVEEQFYLVWPAVVFLLNRRALLWVCGGMIAAALAIRVPLALGVVQFWDPAKQPEMTYYFTPARMDALAVGALIALAAHGPAGIAALARPARFVAPAAAVLVAALFLWNGGSLYYGNRYVQTAGYTLLAALFGAVLVLAVVAPPAGAFGRACTNPVLRFFGKYSYGIYVFHGILAIGLREPGVARVVARSGWPTMTNIAVGIALSVACALVSWHLYEKHFLKLKRFFEYRAATLGKPGLQAEKAGA